MDLDYTSTFNLISNELDAVVSTFLRCKVLTLILNGLNSSLNALEKFLVDTWMQNKTDLYGHEKFAIII